LKVLVVDDDEMVRAVCSGMLRLLKHDVVTAAGGQEAIEQIVEQESRFDVILLDDAMPQMSGRETLAKLLALDVRIPVILCTGKLVTPAEFSESAKGESTKGEPTRGQPVSVLSKPFNLKSLQSALAAVLFQ